LGREAKDNYLIINGLRLHYLEWTEELRPEGECILLLHGITGHAHLWDFFVSKLDDHYHVFALDLRGHGDSQWSDPPAYHSQDYISDLAAFVDELSINHFILIGHSLGSLTSTIYAAFHPNRVKALVLVDIEACPPSWQQEYLHKGGRKAQPIFESLEEMAAREIEYPTGIRLAPANILRHACYHGSRRLPDGKLTYKYDRATLAYFDQYDTRALLPQIKCPTLVIRGEQSVVMRAEVAQDMSRLLPRGIFKEIPHAGHIVFVDNPSGFAQAVTEFLKSFVARN